MKGQATNKQVIFQPWIGKNYECKRNKLGIRLLVLGDSHYDDAPSDDDFSQDEDWKEFRKKHGEEKLTEFVLLKWGRDENIRYRFFTMVANVLLDSSGDRNRQNSKIWDDVAFYNYVSIVPWHENQDRPERPTDEQWINSKNPFNRVLKKIKPDAVLMLGKQLTDWVRYNHNHKEYKQLFVPYKNNDVNYLGIYHPRGGLAYKKANPAFKRLMEETRRCN